MANVIKIFVGGGGDDWFTHIVERYAQRYRESNPNWHYPYFSWSADAAIIDLLNKAPQGSDITVVGHSYGADTAFSAIQRGRPVRTLISIDPVGRFRPAWTTVRTRCMIWLNVRAEPSDGRRTFDDRIAAIGGKYPQPPGAGQPGAPNYAYAVDTTHGDFNGMMQHANGQGISGKSLLGGHGVG